MLKNEHKKPKKQKENFGKKIILFTKKARIDLNDLILIMALAILAAIIGRTQILDYRIAFALAAFSRAIFYCFKIQRSKMTKNQYFFSQKNSVNIVDSICMGIGLLLAAALL